jgi:hypothetical protein
MSCSAGYSAAQSGRRGRPRWLEPVISSGAGAIDRVGLLSALADAKAVHNVALGIEYGGKC